MGQRIISFNYEYNRFTFRDRGKVRNFLLFLCDNEGKTPERLQYIFCSDAYLLNINQEFLRHNTLTDVITFQFSEVSDPIVSEIYISIERIRANAHLYSFPFSHELLRVMIHGALHLCGYKDKTAKDKAIMTLKEDEYLRKYLVSRGTG